MKKPENEEIINPKYYDPKTVTPEEMIRDYVGAEEDAVTKELEDEGYELVGEYTPGNEEEKNAVIDKLVNLLD